MMDNRNAHFTSDSTLDVKAYREYLRLYLNTSRRTLLARSFILTFCVCLIPRLGNNDLSRLFLMFAAVVGVIEFCTYDKYRNGGPEYRDLLGKNSGKTPRNLVYFLDECILFRNPETGNEITQRYDSIVRIAETGNLLFLVTASQQSRLIHKRTLTGGTAAQLIAFLREKCPNLQKRIVRGHLGKILHLLQWVVLVVGVLWSILGFFSIPEKMAGELTNATSYEEMAEELALLDIHISDDVMELVTTGTAYYLPGTPSSHKVYYLLCWEGSGEYLLDGIPTDPHIPGTDVEKLEWVPSVSGVYWFDRDFVNKKTIYTDFLRGIDAMTDELTFENITEDYSQADFGNSSGSVTVTFACNGTAYVLHADYRGRRFDQKVLAQLTDILKKETPLSMLSFCTDFSDGTLVYYGTPAQIGQLEQKTGLIFSLNPN